MTKKEESKFIEDLNDVLSTGEETNKEFYERLILALQVVTSNLESFKYDFQENGKIWNGDEEEEEEEEEDEDE